MGSNGWMTQETVGKAGLASRLEALRADGYVQLTLLTATDWLEEGEFEVSYILTDPHGRRTVILGCRVPREAPELPTVSSIWPAAVTYEQELNEMFGIRFPGSPRQGVPFILEGWKDIPPMRRDFDTLEYSVEHYEDRPGRESIDTRRYVGRVSAERGYTGAWSGRPDEGRKRHLDGPRVTPSVPSSSATEVTADGAARGAKSEGSGAAAGGDESDE